MMTVLLYKDTGKYNEDYSASVPCSSSRGLRVTIITFAWQTKLLELLLLLVFGSQADYFLRNLVQSVINFTLGNLEEWKIKEITVLLLFSMM